MMAGLIKTALVLVAPVAILILVILFGGAYLKLAVWIRAALIAFVVLVWLLIILWKWWSARRRAKAIEKGILLSAQASDRMSPSRRSEIAEVQKNLQEALATLKRGPQGKRALYAIPWYMIIGPPATGKTTAITNSGLNFPSMTTAKRMRGAGGTRNCDWWLSTDAILLDTAGRYAQSEDRSETEEEWFGFLDLLRKSRGRGPINGLILAYSVETLIQRDEVGIVDDARELRQRMDEMLEHLHWSFPVYLLFTKCDLVSGFVEFFGNLSPVERQQVWGATVPIAESADQGAAERFGAEFDTLLRRLRDVRTRRMVGGGRGESWGKVFLFPEELSAIRGKLHLFVETLFEPNPFRKDSPAFRGFYLSSGKQVGQPFEVAVQKIQALLGIGGGAGALAAEAPAYVEREDAYFVRDIFARVFKADRDLSRRSRTASLQMARWQLIGSAALIAISLLVSVLIGGFSYGSLAAKMQRTEKSATEAQRLSGSGPTLATLTTLDALRKEVKSGWRAGLLTAPGAAREKADEIYRAVALAEVFGPCEERIASRLASASTLDGDAARQLLRAEFHLVKTGTEGIGREKELAGTLARLTATDPDEVAKSEELLRGLTEAFLKDRTPVTARDRGYELRAGAERLRDAHAPEPFFEGIVGGASREARDLDLAALVPGQSILKSNGKVRAAFTKAGWEKSVSRDVGDVAKLIEEDKRLLALASVSPSERAPTKEQLVALYEAAFAREWGMFLESIELSDYEDCDDAEDDFKELQSPAGSPLVKLMQESAKQTDLGQLLGVIGGQEQVANAFEPLRVLTKGSDKSPAPIEEFLGKFEEVSDQIADCAKEKDFEPESKVFRKAKEWAGEFSDRFPKARIVGEAIETVLTMPVEAGERLVGGASAGRAGKALAERGGPSGELATLAAFYPFGSSSEPATLDDVRAFFGSDGAMAKFKEEWVESGRIEPSPELDACLEAVESVRRNMAIDDDDFRAAFSFTVSEPRSDGTPIGNANLKLIDRITLVVGGEKYYARAPFGNSQDAEWTTASGEEASSIVLEYTRENKKIAGETAAPGIWSWFQLLDRARSSRRGGGTLFTFKFEEAGIEVDCLIKMRGDDCPFAKGSSFRRLQLPRNLVE